MRNTSHITKGYSITMSISTCLHKTECKDLMEVISKSVCGYGCLNFGFFGQGHPKSKSQKDAASWWLWFVMCHTMPVPQIPNRSRPTSCQSLDAVNLICLQGKGMLRRDVGRKGISYDRNIVGKHWMCMVEVERPHLPLFITMVN